MIKILVQEFLNWICIINSYIIFHLQDIGNKEGDRSFYLLQQLRQKIHHSMNIYPKTNEYKKIHIIQKIPM